MPPPEQCRRKESPATRAVLGPGKGVATRKGVQGGTVSKNETGREMVYQGRTQRQVTGTTATHDTARGGWGDGRTNMIAGKEVSCKLFWPRLKDETIKPELQPLQCLL